MDNTGCSVVAQTEAYRQVACLLAARSIRKRRVGDEQHKNLQAMNNRAMKAGHSDHTIPHDVQVTQHLLKDHPGFIPVNLLVVKDEKAEAAAVQKSSDSYVPVCRECGGALQPGFEGTTIRVKKAVKLSRTARRRASRLKAAAAAAVTKGRGAAASKDENKRRSNLGQYIQQQQHGHQPGDVRMNCAKNFGMLSCGYCGGTSQIAGVDNPKPIYRNKDKKKQGKRTSLRGLEAPSRKSKSTDRRQGAAVAASSSIAAAADGEEFISLAPSKRKKDPPKLGQPKKKKKSKPGDLLNFLSSLND